MASRRSRKTRGQNILEDLTRGSKKWEVNLGGQRVVKYALMLTDEVAHQIIEHCNLRNRNVRQNKVLEWSGAMKAGKWQLRGEIIMTDSGELIDGQHRVLAVAETGVEIPIFLMVIESRNAEQVNRVTDIGVPRNLADYLHFNGVEDAARVAPVLVYERNARVSKNPLQSTRGDKLDYLTLYREIGADSFKRLFDMMPRGLHTLVGVNRAFLDWFGLHAMGVDAGSAELFFGLVMDPSELKKTDAPYILRESLIDLQRKTQKVSLVQQAHMTAKAWRYFGENQPATPGKIKHRINEDWPGVFGEER